MVLPDGNRPSRSPYLGILPPQLIVVVPSVTSGDFLSLEECCTFI